MAKSKFLISMNDVESQELKGKSAICIHRELMGHEKNFTGLHFWARGYCVSTVRLNEEDVREYIRQQEEEDKKQDELQFK